MFRARHGQDSITRAAVRLLTLLALLASSGAGPAFATPRQPAAALLDSILGAHVVGDGVDYDGLLRDRARLTAYLKSLAAFPPESLAALEAPERMAFYLNAYNACTLDLVVGRLGGARGEPSRLRSIRDIAEPWTRPRWPIAGRALSLDEIEHQILRREFREPRVHAALVCASASCPALSGRAFRGERLEAQLEEAARAFVLDPSRNEFAIRDGAIRISSIFDWYGRDFEPGRAGSPYRRRYGETRGAVLDFAARYLPAPAAKALSDRTVRIEFRAYDWSLNDRPRGRPELSPLRAGSSRTSGGSPR